MNARIVADGEARLSQAPEFQAKLRALHQTIAERHAVELSRAGFIRRAVLRWLIAAEYRRERRRILPSAQSLYHTGIA